VARAFFTSAPPPTGGEALRLDILARVLNAKEREDLVNHDQIIPYSYTR